MKTVKRRAVGVINDCNIIQQSRSQEEEECEGLSTASYPPPPQSGPGVMVRTRTTDSSVEVGLCTPILFQFHSISPIFYTFIIL